MKFSAPSPIILFFLIMTVNSIRLFSQISPGDLTDAHAKFEGISNCTKCHVLGEKVYNSKCLECHSILKDLVDKNIGYHSYTDVKGKDCFECHSEHNGRNFRIINFNPDEFDHNKTNFSLTGRHARIDCKSCHQVKYMSNVPLKDNSYLGLREECSTCHEDYHQNTLSLNCRSCHNTDSFKPATKFDHSTSLFKLTGAHEKADCNKCHIKEIRNNKKFQKFKGIVFETCESCHTDVHKGRFGKNCESCHSTASFKNIIKSAFNHDKTDFPLKGKHRFVDCNECHEKGLTVKIEHQKCNNCHADYHRGEFTGNSEIRDCSNCHNVNGFQPSLFTIEKHNKSSFKLNGGHLAVACKNCHYKKEIWHFRIEEGCISCHQNIHGSEIKQEFIPDNNCGYCHSTENWRKISFDHNKTNFTLEGKHKLQNCSSCHYRDEIGERVFRFASLKSDCKNCHQDIHLGQFRESDSSSCQDCHWFENWIPEKFDHNKTRFALTGAHRKVECSGCHKKETENGKIYTKYRMEEFKCASCHS